MSGLLWKLNRLRTMDPAEVLYRVEQLVHGKLQNLGVGLARQPAVPSGRSGRWLTPPPPALLDAIPYLQAADEVLAGRFNVFAMRGAPLGFPPQWNQDPRTGTVAPMVFGKTLNYRDERIVGDIKYLWEPSRHLELVTLAQAWHLSRDARYLSGVRTLLESWMDQCPYMVGVHWVSSLEHSVRLVNWAAAWHLLGGDESPLFAGSDGARFKQRWLTSVFQHCHFISGHFSKHSSANNHLLGEYMGLLFGAMTWPMWPEMRGWAALAQRGFEAEALKQNTHDGVNKEQAVYYHHEVMDMMLLCGTLLRANGQDFSAAYWERLQRMTDFVHALMNQGGEIPMIGDADDALMVRWDPRPDFDLYQALLASGAALFSRADFKFKAEQFGDKNLWLLGAEAAQAFELLPARVEAPVPQFPEGGYYIMGAGFDTPSEVKAVVDCAPLGYLSIAAHGHADALAMVLSVGGKEILSDVGTYAYHTQKAWRDYFRATHAHNTVRVDEQDQSVIGGNFMWLDKAEARCLKFEPSGPIQHFSGTHNGYRRLSDAVTHQRDIDFDAVSSCFKVNDQLSFKGEHIIEVCWNLHEDCTVEVGDDCLTICRDGQTVHLRVVSSSAPLTLSGRKGEDNPIGGWISHRFDEKTPSHQFIWRGRFVGGASIRTEIACTPSTIAQE
ncbi:alginate lyase family protein [Aquabacterium sp. A3]|uniref:heparinase II/III family protein n=1 Tax=Aquabacterium sp. A3 TaxID=3132829 RepID=UPI0031192429